MVMKENLRRVYCIKVTEQLRVKSDKEEETKIKKCLLRNSKPGRHCAVIWHQTVSVAWMQKRPQTLQQ